VRPQRLTLALALITPVVGASACGDDDVPVVDSGVDSASPDVGVDSSVPLVIAAPAPPVLTPCPDGWREVTSEGAPTTCDPFPESGPADCPTTEAHFVGTPGCAPVGSVCPASGFAVDLPPGATVVYVDAASAAGDGSLALPFPTLAEGIAAAPDGAIVAMAPGMYRGDVDLDRPVTVWGACPDVRIGGTSFPFDVDTVGAEIRNVTIWGSASAFLLRSGSELVVRDSVVRDTRQEVVQAIDGGSITMENVALRRVARGIVHTGEGRIVLRRVELRESELPLLLVNGADVALEDVSMLGGTVTTFFPLFLSTEASTGTIERLYADDLEVTRLQVRGGSLTMRDSIVRGSASSTREDDVGVLAAGGAVVSIERVLLDQLHTVAVGALQAGTSLSLTDAWIRDPGVGPLAGRAEAVEMGLGATGTFERIVATGCRGACVLLTDAETTAVMRDTTIASVEAGIGGGGGRALQIQSAARLEGERVVITEAREIAVVTAEGDLELADVVIENTRPAACAPECQSAGIGVGAYLGGIATLTRFRITDGALAGAQVAADGAMDLSDGIIAGHPVGVNVQVSGFDLARLSTRVEFEDNESNLDATDLPVPPPTLGL